MQHADRETTHHVGKNEQHSGAPASAVHNKSRCGHTKQLHNHVV